ncbi:hypothetical protein G7Z17_g13016 [Cylindrodendrum hubeiense]|uniref:SIT4 phosphatase-associated protein n=1 Tax=Cylindrodendrum hubeiense TaxID=595255 RepID=A0A9P5GWL4_9HYPO|nr:hypothetical protein G7Z17_g13016 [Cylindrodendrum hubeiense]
MHQKNNQAAQSSSGALHHVDDDDNDDNPSDPFADTEEDMDDDDEDQDGERGSWWRGVVRTTREKTDGNESDDERDDDDDDEFGDFAMAEDERTAGEDDHNLVLRPLAVNPAKEGSTRGLSGLWPFALSKAEKEKEAEKLGSNDGGSGGLGDNAGDGDEKKAVEVTEATRRTSIEDPDDDEVVI